MAIKTYDFETPIKVYSNEVSDIAEAMADMRLVRKPAVVLVDAVLVEHCVVDFEACTMEAWRRIDIIG